MGTSRVYDTPSLEVNYSHIPPLNLASDVEQGLLVEKCRFLEVSGCLATCIHACKVPTQRFFLEEMGVPVTIYPNVTDMSCRFEFGRYPAPLSEDPISALPCLTTCTIKKREIALTDPKNARRKRDCLTEEFPAAIS